MITDIYLLRHAESLYRADNNDFDRSLSAKGEQDANNIIDYFKELAITKVLSSPYIRAIRTVEGIARDKGLDIELINNLRERKVANEHIEDFNSFAKGQWADFDYKLVGGESLNQVQFRGIKSLKNILKK